MSIIVPVQTGMIRGEDWPFERRVVPDYTATPGVQDTDPEPPTVTIEQFRSLLNKWVERDEARHPDFQDKELIQESKELINKSRI